MKVLVLALDSFGDLALRQPLLSGLLDDGNEVGVVVRSGFERVLPLLDPRLVAHPVSFQYTAAPKAAEARANLDKLAGLQPDLVVRAQFDPVRYADWILRRLPSARHAGFEGGLWQEVPGARALEQELGLWPSRPLDVAVACDPGLPEVEKNAKLLEALLGRSSRPAPPRLTLPEALLARGREHLAELGLAEREYVACCPAGTANVTLKAWPPERYARLLSWLSRERRLPVLVMGHRSEASTVDTVLRMAEGPNLHRFLGRDEDFELMTSLLALSRLYVGNDTGPMHLAAAAGVPVVAVFGGGHWPRFLPAAEVGSVITQDLPCFGCGWRDCVFGDAPCVGLVEEPRVRACVARVLDVGKGFEVVRQPPVPEDEMLTGTLAGFRALSQEAARRLDELLVRDAEIGRLQQHIQSYDDTVRNLQGHIRKYDDMVLDLSKQNRSFREAIRTFEAQAWEREARIREQQADIQRLDLTARHAPLVSIVTPTFNAARWLERCILSVHEQDYPKVEHIIVDGGSTDGTLEICSRYPHLVVHSAPDRGQSDALNRGFAMARGEILAWLCADDEYLPKALSTAVDSVLAGNDLVVGNCQFIDADGRGIAAHPANARHSIDHDTVLRFWRVTLPQPAAFWRRRLWERCGPLREDLHFTMDYDLWLRMTRVTAVERVGVDLAAYRIHPDAKCFADNYGSRLELLQVSRSYWPPSWHPGHWRLAFEHWVSGRDITRHYTDAERLRERAFHKLREGRRLEAFVAFAKMHAAHPRSPALPDYRRLVRKLAGSLVPAFLAPLAQAALKRWRRADRVVA